MAWKQSVGPKVCSTYIKQDGNPPWQQTDKGQQDYQRQHHHRRRISSAGVFQTAVIVLMHRAGGRGLVGWAVVTPDCLFSCSF